MHLTDWGKTNKFVVSRQVQTSYNALSPTQMPSVTATGKGEINSSASNVIIGASGEGSSGNFNGLIDEVRLYSSSLTEHQIKALYQFSDGIATPNVGNTFAPPSTSTRV